MTPAGRTKAVVSAALLAVVLCGGCSAGTGDGAENGTGSPAPVTLSSSPTVTASSTSRTFASSDGNISCAFADGGVACDIASGVRLVGHGPGDVCAPMAAAGLRLDAHGVWWDCRTDVLAPDAPTLPEGSSVTVDGIRCASVASGVRCSDGSTHSRFTVARAHSSVMVAGVFPFPVLAATVLPGTICEVEDPGPTYGTAKVVQAQCQVPPHAAWRPANDVCHVVELQGVVLAAGRTRWLCAGDVQFPMTPMPDLTAAAPLAGGPVTCARKGAGVSCRNSDTGHGFTLSRTAYTRT